MPSHQRVKDLITWVTHHRFLDALREFYHDDVAVQENDETPRIGLHANIEHEVNFLDHVSEIYSIGARSFLVDGDLAAIRWLIDVSLKNGRRMFRDEIAYQRWHGDKIICEQFYYDSDQSEKSDRQQLSERSQEYRW